MSDVRKCYEEDFVFCSVISTAVNSRSEELIIGKVLYKEEDDIFLYIYIYLDVQMYELFL